MALTKPTGSWTYEDLSDLPDDGRRFEIIEGALYEMPSPTWVHATVIANLITMLLPLIMRLGGIWRPAPLDVFFSGANPVQPGIIVLLPGGEAHPAIEASKVRLTSSSRSSVLQTGITTS
jgi:Uma2 family endonuclease